MQIFPTESEIERTAELLVEKYHVSPQLLGQLFGTTQRDNANSILKARLTPLDVARLLVRQKGPELFTGSHKDTRKLRSHLLGQLANEKVEKLFEQYDSKGKNISSPSRMRTLLVERKWYAGRHWARDFVEELGFPPIFAGIKPPPEVPPIQDVPPLKKPPKLAAFQKDLKAKMLAVLKQEGDRTRCVVTLPTGGGKTRVAVEAFIDWMQPRFAEGKYLIWIAQSEELCEQAIACIEQMWGSRQFVGSLRIYRFFGGRDIPEDELHGGAVVASIQQLHRRIGDKSFETILSNTGAMIIDEAHRAVSQMYNGLLDTAEKICGSDLFPICGLTATPGRSDRETDKLVGRFEAYLIKPDLGPEYKQNPLRYFRKHKFLAQAHHILYRSGREYTLTDDEAEKVKKDKDLPAEFLKRLADDNRRNRLIMCKLLSLPQGTSTLVYACTVEHAYFLSALLSAEGRKAGAVSSETSITLRRALIDDFKKQNIEFLCNYGVLTTGFDAPKVRCIALCRPTTSEVLYEQIIGRGLRGPEFGGTPECTIIDFADNIRRFGAPRAYKRFEYPWLACRQFEYLWSDQTVEQ